MLAVPRVVKRYRHLLTAPGAATGSADDVWAPIRVAAITDEYTAAMLSGAFQVVHLHPLAGRQIERFEPDGAVRRVSVDRAFRAVAV